MSVGSWSFYEVGQYLEKNLGHEHVNSTQVSITE